MKMKLFLAILAVGLLSSTATAFVLEANHAPKSTQLVPTVQLHEREAAPQNGQEEPPKVEPAKEKSEPAPAFKAEPALEIEEPPAVEVPAPKADPEPAPKASNSISFRGLTYQFKPGGREQGQAVIDQNPNEVSSWGGEAMGNTQDGLSTHFIGHNFGAFGAVLQIQVGDVITVLDGASQQRDYRVNQTFDVNDNAIGIQDKSDHWEEITGTAGGERIVLQTCVNDEINRIVMAS